MWIRELRELGLSKHPPWGWVGMQGHSLALRGPQPPMAPWYLSLVENEVY